MDKERRSAIRLVRSFEGTWSGASGATACRVADVSIGGCFVHSMAVPRVGERIVVTITTPATELTLEGNVVYVERAMGFGVKFCRPSPELLTQLERFLDSYRKVSA